MEMQAPELVALKARQKATWMSGDFGEVAKLTEAVHVCFGLHGPLVMQMPSPSSGTGVNGDSPLAAVSQADPNV